MTTSDAIQLAIAVPIASGFFVGLVVWAFNLALKLRLILQQVTPNGGSSMSDRVSRLEVTQAAQTKMLKEIKTHFNISMEEKS